MKTRGRLIKKEKAILLIKKSSNLILGQSYNIIFSEINKEAICENAILRQFNEDYYYIQIPTKLKGFLKLEYQKDYSIEIKEVKE